jgi:hypothetical protein
MEAEVSLVVDYPTQTISITSKNEVAYSFRHHELASEEDYFAVLKLLHYCRCHVVSAADSRIKENRKNKNGK